MRKPTNRRAQASVTKTRRGMNRNLLVLGTLTLLMLGGLGIYIASRNAGSSINATTNIRNEILNNSYFTQLIASGATTEKDLEAVTGIHPLGEGFIGLSKEFRNWSQAQDLTTRTGAEILQVDVDTMESRQLLDWLVENFAPLTPPVWVRQQGEARVLDGRDILQGSNPDRPRLAYLHWLPLNSGQSPVSFVTASKEQPFINSLGMKFVPVSVAGGNRILFCVWETRVQDYEIFAREAKSNWRGSGIGQSPAHPVINVSWEDAKAFCAWLTTRERQDSTIGVSDSYRLPGDHEWSCAAGIWDQEDANLPPGEKIGIVSNILPWGSEWPPPTGDANLTSPVTGLECP